MLTDHPAVEALQGDDSMQQQHQQLVRERGRRIKAAAELGLARSSSRGRRWGRALGRRVLTVLPKKDAAATFVPAAATQQPLVKEAARREEQKEEEEDEEGLAVDEKVALLRQLVPGGEDMEAEGLLEETADYIAALKAQVGVMRALASMLSGAGLDNALPPPGKADGHVITPEK